MRNTLRFVFLSKWGGRRIDGRGMGGGGDDDMDEGIDGGVPINSRCSLLGLLGVGVSG